MPGTYLVFFFFFFAFVARVLFCIFFAVFFLAASFVTFFAACFFAVFFFAPFIAAACLTAFLAAFFLAGACLFPVMPDLLEGFCAVLSVVFLLRLLAGFLFFGTVVSTGFVSTSCWMEIFGSATTAAT